MSEDEQEVSDYSNKNETVVPLTDEHQEAIGNAFVQAAEDRGIDVTTLAQQIGLTTDDINAFTQGDYLKVARHLATEHPEIVRNLTSHIPVIGGLIGSFFGGNQ